MITQKPAAERLLRRALPIAAAALLLASLSLTAQERSRPSDSSDVGRTAHEIGARSFAPAVEPSTPSAPSVPSLPSEPAAPSVPSTPSEPSAPSEPETPSEDFSPEPIRIAQERSRPSDSSDAGRTAHEVGSRGSSSSSSSPPSASSGGSSSSSGDSGRTARPTGSDGSEPHRQPPSRGDRGDRGHHGGGHHGGHGGFYYPYGYYGPYGYWPGFRWWGWWWYDDPYYGYPYGHGQPRYYGEGNVGALDLDVAPGRTEVHLDGQYIGRVDAFDGWPRYLWLPKGTYDIVFYLDGYKTVARQISVYPGSVIDIDEHMVPGDSVRPEDLVSKSHEKRDERLRNDREQRDRVERGDDFGDEDWRDRVRRERGDGRDYDRDRDDDEDVDVQEDSPRKGRLRLDVEPEDASVYLDGRFVGTGTELGLMRGGLPVTPGDHRLAVVRPGRKAEEHEFRVDPGEEVELEVDLEADSR
jgi:hypothetical protein